MTFSIVISTYNRNEDLVKCLKALCLQTYKNFKVIIVNGGLKETVRKVINEFCELSIKLIEQEERGLVEARNLGWQNSDSDIICFIDDDLVVMPNWLDEIRRTFSLSDNIGGVSGPTIIPSQSLNNRDFAVFLEAIQTSKNILLSIIGYIYKNVILENKIYEVGKILPSGVFTPGSNYKKCLELNNLIDIDYLEACHMCFRRKLLKKIGGFDYSYTGTGEWSEPDFSFKVRRLGYKLIFNPKAITEHHVSQSGIFKARTNAYERSINFIHFYFRNVKPDNLNKIIRFSTNLFFINTYWCYKFIETKNFNWLSGITGILLGLAKEMCR